MLPVLVDVAAWVAVSALWAGLGMGGGFGIGLIYTRHGYRAGYRLRLVLKDNEPPRERYLTEAQLRPYATGPVVMALVKLADEPAADTRSARCRNRIATELARHGVPSPPPRAWVYRTPAYTDEESTRAAAFRAAVQEVVPATWTVEHSALPPAGR
jgi:hypothetical protein